MGFTRLPTQTLRRLVRNRNFRIYLAGRTASVVGDSFYTVALILGVLQATHSVTSGAIVLVAGTIPVLLLTLIGGTLSDRLPRNRVMICSDLVRSATQLLMAGLLCRSNPPIWALVFVQFSYGAGEAFFNPASTGLLPQIVESEDLPAANSILQFISNGALVAGPALAGIIIAFAGAPLAIALDGITFLASAISLAFLILPEHVRTFSTGSLWTQLRAGFDELRRHRWILVTTSYFATLAFAFNGTMLALGPAAAVSRLGGPSAWSLVLSTFGVGLISGSFIAPGLLRTRRALGWAYVCNLGLIPMLILFGTSHSVWLVCAASALAGLAVSLFSVTFTTLLQQAVSPKIVSRVSSYFWLARVAPMPLAFAIVGPLSAKFGLSAVFDVAALVIAAATIGSASVPDIWAIDSQAQEN